MYLHKDKALGDVRSTLTACRPHGVYAFSAARSADHALRTAATENLLSARPSPGARLCAWVGNSEPDLPNTPLFRWERGISNVDARMLPRSLPKNRI